MSADWWAPTLFCIAEQNSSEVKRVRGSGIFFCASSEGRTGVSSYSGEGRHLGGIIGIPWPGSEAGLGVHVAIISNQENRGFSVFLPTSGKQKIR